MIRLLGCLLRFSAMGTVLAEGASASINFSAVAAQEAPKSASDRPTAAAQTVSESIAQPPFSHTQKMAEVASIAEGYLWQRDFYKQTWEWHLFSTKVLMVVVLVILGFGLFVTYVQFKREYVDRATPTAGVVGEPPPSTPSGSLKIGPSGLEITSQVIGLFVLAFSLGFFYLYVKEVYPMQEIALQQKAAQQSAVVK